MSNQTVIRGYGGQYLDYNNPTAYEFSIAEFAHSLSKICRFAGHCRSHYSVAQHSVLVSDMMPEERDIQLQALLHDAAESFMADVPSPLKRIIGGHYKEIETRIQKAIFTQFGLPEEMNSFVNSADKYILSAERRDLLPKDGIDGWDAQFWPDWMIDNPIHKTIYPMPDHESELLFTNRAKELL